MKTVGAHFPQGVYFIELVAVVTIDPIPGAILASLGALHASVSEPLRHLQNHLRQRRLLLVLDNFEHMSRHQRWLYLINQWLQTLIILLSGDLPAARQSAQAMLVRFQNGDFPALFYSQTVEPKFWQAHVYALLGLIAWQLGIYLVVVLPADTFSAATARGQAWTQTALLEQMRMQ